MGPADKEKDLIEMLREGIKGAISLNEFKNAIGELATAGTMINKTFTQGRTRIVEMQQAVADAVPGINRLGGEILDVVEIIQQVSEATNRNVIAGTESIEKLYAASQIISDIDTETLVSNFADVGYTFEKIPKLLEDSIHYVQSIGGNASSVMSDVVREVDKLNRFQFQDGVRGLTKMAAQASMLKFDMSETFRFADEVMNPEGAIQMASAFQRLGVASGDLVDPFQLMNKSINDPSGLQTSLANVSKQFTYFDEKTKSFRISRQGVMILGEMEQAAKLTAGSLSKMGIAQAELNSRLSQINPSIKFENEEDKQYLANIASMSEQGEYVVAIKKPGEDPQMKKLTDVTQDELKKLIDEQKKAQKPIEEIQRDQLSLAELQAGDIAAIKNKIVFGVSSTAFGLEATEAYRKGTSEVLGSASAREGIASVKDIRAMTQAGIDGIKNLIKDATSDKGFFDSLEDFGGKMKDNFANIGVKIDSGFDAYVKKLKSNKFGLSDSSEIEKMLIENFEKMVGKATGASLGSNIQLPAGLSQLIGGGEFTDTSKFSSLEKTMKVKHDMDEITIRHIHEPSAAFERMNVHLTDFIFTQSVNEGKFKNFIIDVVRESQNGKSSKNITAYYK